jgi:hypothetical protein
VKGERREAKAAVRHSEHVADGRSDTVMPCSDPNVWTLGCSPSLCLCVCNPKGAFVFGIVFSSGSRLCAPSPFYSLFAHRTF